MPIRIRGNESQSTFMSRCISTEINSGKKPSQAQAICIRAWTDRKRKEQDVDDEELFDNGFLNPPKDNTKFRDSEDQIHDNLSRNQTIQEDPTDDQIQDEGFSPPVDVADERDGQVNRGSESSLFEDSMFGKRPSKT